MLNKSKDECRGGLEYDQQELLKSSKLADFRILADGQQFSCHKLMLATRSPVFERMLASGMGESAGNEMTLTDISPDTVADMLSYIYTDTIENLPEKAQDLLPVAEKYDLVGLKIMCSTALLKQIKLDNTVELALLADLYTAKDLREAGLCFILANKKHYQGDPVWREAFKKNPTLLLDMFEMFCWMLMCSFHPGPIFYSH